MLWGAVALSAWPAPSPLINTVKGVWRGGLRMPGTQTRAPGGGAGRTHTHQPK
jgi:hypothetical protein